MRKLLTIMLCTLAAAGGVAYAIAAVGAGGAAARGLELSVTPAVQDLARGGAISFSVDLERRVQKRLALRLRGLPRGVRARWRLSDGRRTRALPAGEGGLVLTLRASRRARLGKRRVRVVARAGRVKVSRRLELRVMPRRAARFRLEVTPGRRMVAAGARIGYRVRVVRFHGFRRRVTLRAVGAMRATVSPRRLRGQRTASVAAAATPVGTYRVVIQGSSRVRGRTIRRYAVVWLVVREPSSFEISGDLLDRLRPGYEAPVDLELVNPHPHDVLVTELSVALGETASQGECDSAANYAVRQYSGTYPIVLRPGSNELNALVADPAELPAVAMLDLPTNQDACKGAVVALDYSGEATR